MCTWIIQNYLAIDKGDAIRLAVNVFEEGTKRELWYEVPLAIKDSLLDNCLDAFLVAILPIAMMHGSDIKVKGRISERLHYSLVNNVIPLLSNNSTIYQSIQVTADELCVFPCHKGHIGTGLSCGVDSFDTILSLKQKGIPDSLDTLTFFNVGFHRSTSGFNDEESRNLFSARLKMNENCAREIGLPMLVIDSNLGWYIHEHKVMFVQVHAFCSLSAVLACGSYFNWYYYSSANTTKDYDSKKCDKDTAYIELSLCPWLSTEYTEFVSYGFTKTRLQKVREIADSGLVQKYLNVCWKEAENCGKCPKCVRTQMELYAIGKIEEFGDVFDVDAFFNQFDEYKKSVYQKRNDDRFFEEIIEELEKKIHPSLWQRFLSHIQRKKKDADEVRHKSKVFIYPLKNAGDCFNYDLLEFFRADMNSVEIVASADLLMLGGSISSLQNPELTFNPAPLHVWGAGFLFGDDNDLPLCRPNLVVHALRGKLSKDKLYGLLNTPLPENIPLADPGLLASYFTTPNTEKKYAIGFIPHFREHDTDEVKRVLGANASMHFIDITQSPKEVIREIQQCETVVSSSLHGLAFSDSLGVPNVHVRLTELPKGGTFKFRDYYSAFGLSDPTLSVEDVFGITPDKIKTNYAIERRVVEEKKRQLIESFPFL